MQHSTATRPSFSSRPTRTAKATRRSGAAPAGPESTELCSGALSGLGSRGDLDEMLSVGLLGTRVAGSGGAAWTPEMVAGARAMFAPQRW